MERELRCLYCAPPPTVRPRAHHKTTITTTLCILLYILQQSLQQSLTVTSALQQSLQSITHARARARTHVRTHARTHVHTHTRLTALCPGLPGWARTRKVTRSSAIAEGPRDTSCQLKYCQLPRNSAETTYTTSPDKNRWYEVGDLVGGNA